jgi:predicted anti-sigma-YlaC factor YlaD
MKPCPNNRKRITWLALDALDGREAGALREHLGRCEGCRRYWQELSNVARQLAAAAPDSEVEATERFYRRLAERLPGVQYRSVREGPARWLREVMRGWRVALPAIAVLLIAGLRWVASPSRPAAAPPTAPTVQVGDYSDSSREMAPTLANYQVIAGQSLERLDELLTQHGNRRLPPAPLFTASAFELTHTSF